MELRKHTDRIADLVGVDKSLLTHRQPRPTHVKAQGAHGANRPGTNVPADVQSLKKYGDRCHGDLRGVGKELFGDVG